MSTPAIDTVGAGLTPASDSDRAGREQAVIGRAVTDVRAMFQATPLTRR